MATVNLKLKSVKNPANIYIRFVNGKAIDIMSPTGIFVNPANWDKKNQKIKNVIEVQNRDEINSKLAKMKIFLIDEFNLDFLNGEIINTSWVSSKISLFQNRPKGEIKKLNLDKNIYLTDFAEDWLKNKAPFWKVKANKYMDDRTIGNYSMANTVIMKFQGSKKILFKDITSDLIDKFSIFLTEQNYAEETSKRLVGRFKFFCARAKSAGFTIDESFTDRIFVQKESEDFKHPYLNEVEITKIFKYDFSHNKALDDARDNFIIGLWTGLRISDFLRRIKVSNFNEGFIEIKTLKTDTWVSIPVHKQIENILRKRKGILPAKVSDAKFNKRIKEICQIVEIDEVIKGAVTMVDEETKIKRKVVAMYPKYKLVSSHICRRSFCTNLIGKVPNTVICDIAGWSSERQMLKYNKTTKRESAMQLQNYWETK